MYDKLSIQFSCLLSKFEANASQNLTIQIVATLSSVIFSAIKRNFPARITVK